VKEVSTEGGQVKMPKRVIRKEKGLRRHKKEKKGPDRATHQKEREKKARRSRSLREVTREKGCPRCRSTGGKGLLLKRNFQRHSRKKFRSLRAYKKKKNCNAKGYTERRKSGTTGGGGHSQQSWQNKVQKTLLVAIRTEKNGRGGKVDGKRVTLKKCRQRTFHGR